MPKAALEAYSLLYDIRQKKPALELREGEFFNGIPGISIKTDKKFEDKETLKGIKIYDHRDNSGNQDVTTADSGRMYTILNERYLKLELFNGLKYKAGSASEASLVNQSRSQQKETLSRSKFEKSQIVFDLSSFDLERTDKKWFAGNRIMRNVLELDRDIDSINRKVLLQRVNYYRHKPTFFSYLFLGDSIVMPYEVYKMQIEIDSINKIRTDSVANTRREDKTDPADSKISIPDSLAEKIEASRKLTRFTAPVTDSTVKPKNNLIPTDSLRKKLDSVFNMTPNMMVYQNAANMARQVKAQVTTNNATLESYRDEYKTFAIQWHKIISNSIACIAMFLIGAPLGSIIKEEGLEFHFWFPFFFFIVFYLLNMQGEKWVKQDLVSPVQGIWTANFVLIHNRIVFPTSSAS